MVSPRCPAAEVWLADPGRNGLETFLSGADATGWRRDQLPGDGDLATVHRFRGPPDAAGSVRGGR